MPRLVAAVVAPANNSLVALDLFAKGVLAARENQTHGGGSHRSRVGLSKFGVVRVLRYGVGSLGSLGKVPYWLLNSTMEMTKGRKGSGRGRRTVGGL